MNGNLCVIWSIEHTAWWAPHERGYTRRLADAGVYTYARAAEIVKDTNIAAFHECLIPLECVDRASEQLEKPRDV